ncbi:hypothetical protein HPB47_024467 [Ixodes persulcatus]|uniref:Uncharacterized protein n=1 Tax=Ixodes persulcatus TaxID=34615 RepID=A0AC60Q661_IXOPE|nr:hypothetical protein HPB47_024467 [Ixodes persulcatus]
MILAGPYQDSRLREAGAEVAYCPTSGAPKGANVPHPGLNHSTIRMPFSPDTGKPCTARRARPIPNGSGSVVTSLNKHLLMQVIPASVRSVNFRPNFVFGEFIDQLNLLTSYDRGGAAVERERSEGLLGGAAVRPRSFPPYDSVGSRGTSVRPSGTRRHTRRDPVAPWVLLLDGAFPAVHAHEALVPHPNTAIPAAAPAGPRPWGLGPDADEGVNVARRPPGTPTRGDVRRQGQAAAGVPLRTWDCALGAPQSNVRSILPASLDDGGIAALFFPG